jgi:parallel beta-helix repeat protein
MAATVTFTYNATTITLPAPDYPGEPGIDLDQQRFRAMGGRVVSVTLSGSLKATPTLHWSLLGDTDFEALKAFIYTTVSGATNAFFYTDWTGETITAKYLGGIEAARMVNYDAWEVHLRLAEVEGVDMGIVVPAYFYASHSEWDFLAEAALNVPLIAIMNPYDGPGLSYDSLYAEKVDAVRAAGGQVIGYVYTEYGTRSLALVKADIDQYYAWYNIDGIFLDEAPTDDDPTLLDYYAELYEYIRSAHPGAIVMLNPGTDPAAAYMAVGTHLMIFEDDFTVASFLDWTPEAWMVSADPNIFAVLQHNCASSDDAVDIVQHAYANGIRWVYVTDDTAPNPWNTLPGYWDVLVQAVDSVAIPGSGSSGGGTTDNPVPAIMSIDPDTVSVGDPGFTLTVTGTGFIEGSIASVEGETRSTVYIDANTIQVGILAGDVDAAGDLSITVTNPPPGGGTSAETVLTVMVVEGGYFVDPDLGDDENDGLSSSSPWQTLTKVSAASFVGDDFVRFKRGTTARGTLDINSSGTSGHPITFTAYGDGTAPRILGSPGPESAWDQTAIGGTPLPSNTWKCTWSSEPEQVWFIDNDGDVHWGTLVAALADVNGAYEYYWHSSGYLVVYSATNPASAWDAVEGSVTAIGIDMTGCSYVTVENFQVAYQTQYGIKLQQASNNLVDSNTVHHLGTLNGDWPNEGIAIYANGTTASTNTISNNYVYQVGRHGIAILSNGNGTCQNNVIDNNTVEDAYHSLIDFQTWAAGTVTSGNRIINNLLRVTDDYQNWSLDCNGIFVNTNTSAVMGTLDISYNLITCPMAAGIVLSTGTFNGATVDNNTIGPHHASSASTIKYGLQFTSGCTGTGSGIKARNNQLANPTNYAIYIGGSSTTKLAEMDYNLIYSTANKYAYMNSVAYHSDDLDLLQSNSAYGDHDIWGSDPDLDADFYPNAASPCVDAGKSIGLTIDRNGVTVPQGAGVDIGCFEYVGGGA